MTLSDLKFFVVQNRDGWFYARKPTNHYGGSKKQVSWVSDAEKARVYTKVGPARSVVTFWAGEYPDYGVPSIVELSVGAIRTLDETAKVSKANDAKAKREAEYARCRKENARIAAERQIAEATKVLDDLG